MNTPEMAGPDFLLYTWFCDPKVSMIILIYIYIVGINIYIYKEFQDLSIRIVRKNFLWGEYLIKNNKKETTRRKNLGKTNILSNSNITTDIFRKN